MPRGRCWPPRASASPWPRPTCLLPSEIRLTEWQRLTAAALLNRLIHGLEDALRARLAARFEAHPALHAALSSARVPIVLPILERAQALRDARARQSPRPPGRGASLLEGACAGIRPGHPCSNWSAIPTRHRGRSDGAGDRPRAALSTASRSPTSARSTFPPSSSIASPGSSPRRCAITSSSITKARGGRRPDRGKRRRAARRL